MECLNCKASIKPVWKYCPDCGFEVVAKPQLHIVSEKESTPADDPAFGNSVRAQVFEVIVRQAIAGAPWREICAGPMQVNNISEKEIEAELRRRKGSDYLERDEIEKLKMLDSIANDNLIELNFKPTSKRLRDSFSSISNLTKPDLFSNRKAMVKQKRVLTDLSELIEIIEKLENDQMKGD